MMKVVGVAILLLAQSIHTSAQVPLPTTTSTTSTTPPRDRTITTTSTTSTTPPRDRTITTTSTTSTTPGKAPGPVILPGEDCFLPCGGKLGFCAAVCGYGNACCRRDPGDAINPLECEAVPLAAFNLTKATAAPGYAECLEPKWDGKKHWVISSEEACKGKEKEVKQCDGLPACGKCIPVNCEFTAWTDWINPKDGTGLQFRSRNVGNFNNECGTPCKGVLKETEPAPLEPPDEGLIPCELGVWTEWTECDAGGQHFRSRTLPEIPPQKYTAHGCNGGVNETKPCNKLNPVDCELGEWSAWTTCSKTCGVGRATRHRTVVTRLEHGGAPCEDLTLEQKLCGEGPCEPPADCVFDDWSDWTAFEAQLPAPEPKLIELTDVRTTGSIAITKGEAVNSTSKFRKRELKAPANWPGQSGCEGFMLELEGAPEAPPKPCPPQDWSDWSACQSSCGAGQQFRRKGTCLSQALPDQETRPCIDPPLCPDHGGDCEMSDWTEWATCDAKCGPGQSARHRDIIKGRTEGGEGCNASLKELKACQAAPCVKQDCKWTEWAEWDACSCTCGGGQKTRVRSVAAAPRNGGAPCANNSVSEVIPCATQSCSEKCVDGEWGSWGNWGVASASCGPSYHCRQRQVAVQENWCGKPAEGNEEECAAVEGPEPCEPDKDCLLEEWGVWSPCSCSCFGVTQRTRGIGQMPTGAGKGCEGNLTEIAQCNPVASAWKTAPPAGCNDAAKEKPVCQIGAWTEWSTCTATCEGGFKMRNRMVLNEPCQAEEVEGYVLDEITGCANVLCQAATLDCKVTDWSEWTSCASCGGNRYRTRAWAQDATQEGKLCDHIPVKEVSNCTSVCNVYKCEWSNWTKEESCTATCGASVSKLKRSLVATPVHGLVAPPAQTIKPGSFNGSMYVQEERFCSGSEVKLEACPVPDCPADCKPMTCTFGAWSEWTLYDTCGYLERHRHRNFCSECSVQVNGTLAETKVDEVARAACEHKEPVNCMFGPWGSWSHCINTNDQTTRVREIQVHARNNGVGCNGTLQETKGCGKNIDEDQSCEISAWSTWGECREVCENPAKLGEDDTGCPTGVQERTRTVLRYARGKGAPCNASLDEVQTCPLKPDTCVGRKIEHCTLTEWAEWGTCSLLGEETRARGTTLVPGSGECGCHEAIKENTHCETPPEDCEYTAYVFSDCVNGHKTGHRQVKTVPTANGKPCEESLVIIEPCEDKDKIPIMDCQMSLWTEWSTCSGLTGTTCGHGHQLRNRTIIKKADYGGVPCEGGTAEFRGCDGPKCIPDTDCEWYDWEDWHACTCTCGGGQKERSRHVKHFPTGNGKRCEVQNMKEAAPCNTQACDQCINGTFSEWGDWDCCSTSCVGGTRMRSRGIATTASGCGYPPEGLLQEVLACSVDVPCVSQDCILGEWSPWSACSSSCGGNQYRTRGIKQQGYGTGAFCTGVTEEYQPCNPALGGATPSGCPAPPPEPVECEWEQWSEWGGCSKTCGTGGQRYQSRRHNEAPEGSHFSVPCYGPSLKTGACEPLADCDEGLGQLKIDCKWSPWGEWGACTKEGGQRHRHRAIIQAAEHGGAPCVAHGETLVAMQTDGTQCFNRDLSDKLQYCGWGDWEDWGACSSTCGSAVKMRERSLGYTNAQPLESRLEEENLALKEQLQVGSTVKAQHIAVAFCSGAATLVLVLGVFRIVGPCRADRYQVLPSAPQIFSRSPYSQLNPEIGEEAYGARTLEGGLE